ncbi:hypothetical protein M422DRAFT_276631 [Sphaerobolus stellatus SS14]|uniref:Unplaced genomic scaffold SPHSTscaffold_819, whole genome shotgun sequence n=1 Tax=Sphaerobolus stellatus (strain SS14) TaxID=990650 RepID=A0A0C9U1K5_SPHS4|nr:hypothetical protein M422DRAFT_276631 [Sphaerobolus stellatus SS14]
MPEHSPEPTPTPSVSAPTTTPTPPPSTPPPMYSISPSSTPSTIRAPELTVQPTTPEFPVLFIEEPLVGVERSSRWPSSLSSESTPTMDTISRNLSSPTTVPTIPPTSSSSSSSIVRRPTPLPPSSPSTPVSRPFTMTPERTFTVSISTSYSNAPSIASRLETVPSSVSEEEIPERRLSEIISHDGNRLSEYLHSIDIVRNGQYSDMSRHLDRIKGELLDLANSIRENEENRREQPPPVPVKDVLVGRSAAMPSLPPSSPATVTYLDLPPERPSSPSSMASSISWLSSHHSNDYFLMPIEDVDELSLIRVAPQIPAPPTPSPPSSPSSSSILASAASSAGTVIEDIRVMIQCLVQETAERQPPAPVTTTIIREVPVQTMPMRSEETAEQRSCREMIQRIERDLADMLCRLASEPSPSETTTGSISELSTIFMYRSPPILQPTPVPGRPLHSELLSDLGPMPTQHPIQLEPLPSIVRPPSRA